MAPIDRPLVHENEAQRRHARVKLPARLLLEGSGKTEQQLDILDLSVSGFCVDSPQGILREKDHYKGVVLFKVNTIAFHLPVQFDVLHYNADSQKAGCVFDQLGPEEVSLLHLFIGKYLTGELVTNGDIISTLNRNNFTRARSKKPPQTMSGFKKFRAVAGTTLAACIGLLALGVIATNLYHHFFVTRAVTAMIDIDHEIIESPSSGYLEVIETNNGKVLKGKPIASISSPVLDYLRGIEGKLTGRENIGSLLPEQIHSVVKSPCDGIIIDNRVTDERYVEKGEPLFTLAKEGDTPYVRAAFLYADADRLPMGKKVSLQFPGTPSYFSGTIEDIRVDINGTGDRIIAIIRPDDALMFNTINKPVHVLVNSDPQGVPVLSSVLDDLSLITSAVAQSR